MVSRFNLILYLHIYGVSNSKLFLDRNYCLRYFKFKKSTLYSLVFFCCESKLLGANATISMKLHFHWQQCWHIEAIDLNFE